MKTCEECIHSEVLPDDSVYCEYWARKIENLEPCFHFEPFDQEKPE
jgi:hypothetical protein